MDVAAIRAWRAHRQGLDGRMMGLAPADVLAETGWARSIAGAGPYLGLFARAGAGRAVVDAAAAALELHELPSARGCTYVVPACDYALALKVGQGFEGERKTAAKLGVTAKEIDKLCTLTLDALARGPLDPAQLRDALAGAVRDLGPEGVKKGLVSTLPVALKRLQSEGAIRRVPVNGRLDQQRYRYVVWSPNPLERFCLSAEEVYRELARRFFEWTGPAALQEFQWFSGLGAKAAKAAVAPLELVPYADGLLLPQQRERIEAFRTPGRAQFVLVSSLDGVAHLRRDVKSLLAPEDLVWRVGGKTRTGVSDLPSHAILDRGRLVGLWEYDTESGSIVWAAMVPASPALKKAVARTEQYVRDELGDARAFSLDSPKSRRPRIEALRNANWRG